MQLDHVKHNVCRWTPGHSSTRLRAANISFPCCDIKALVIPRIHSLLLLRPGRGAEYCDQYVCVCACLSVCLSSSISLEPLGQSARNFVCRSPVPWLGPPPLGVALRYVLPVWRMTSRLAVMGATSKGGGCTVRRRRRMMWRYRGRVWCLWMLVRGGDECVGFNVPFDTL